MFAVGRFTIDNPTVLELSLLSTDGVYWKGGFSWDYFALLSVKSPLLSLKENCCSTIVNHINTSKGLWQYNRQVQRQAVISCIDAIRLPKILISQLKNYVLNPPCHLSSFFESSQPCHSQLLSNPAEINTYDSSGDGNDDDYDSYDDDWSSDGIPDSNDET